MKDKTKLFIGLILCLTGIALILYIFVLKLLIIIPILLFLISLVFKSRILSISLNSLTILPFLVVYVGMRLPTSRSIIIESRIRYQMIDFGQGNFIRNGIEYKLHNRRIFLQDTVNGIRWLYISSSDFKKLWPEPPFKMQEKNYTMKAKFKTYKLLNGEYSKATLLELDSIPERPMITK